MIANIVGVINLINVYKMFCEMFVNQQYYLFHVQSNCQNCYVSLLKIVFNKILCSVLCSVFY